ncbi:hypothetical protein [Halomonas heilongjiangensis]|uniref:Uncharacterized protein n=1 Tax=Halomonas heilongjiangensis TaxID=1387883 RepID=A0A2N7TPN3_9GAMM|nr:hypothetical protein [Halomonas heilongjiangensis]PMR70150.1 hypothetical protein C1H66_08680 [Halomonas heilongjiangensis]PXX94513.1 hypothetical protein CR158_00980 [Halomonas heilongjiangensis]
MRVLARLVLAPWLFLFMAVSPLSAQDPSAAKASPALHSSALHPDGLSPSARMVASSSVHVDILWRRGGLVSTQFAFGTFDRHHRHGVTHMHRHPPGTVVITPRHGVRHHDGHRWRHVPRHSDRGIRHRTRRHDDVKFGTPGRIHSPAVDIGPRRFERPGRVIRHPIRRHDDMRFGTPGRMHSPAVDFGPRRFERERFAPSHRGIEPHHFQRRAPLRIASSIRASSGGRRFAAASNTGTSSGARPFAVASSAITSADEACRNGGSLLRFPHRLLPF